MTPLRQQMIDAMQVRGMSPKTHRSYLGAVVDLARYYHRSPDQVSGEELQAFFLYLVKERHVSPASCRLYLNALRFFYLHVLNRDSFGVTLHVPRREQRIPELLMRSEIAQMLAATVTFRFILGERNNVTTGDSCVLQTGCSPGETWPHP